MPNLYASLAEIKGGMPDGFRASTTKYDTTLLRLSSEVSRAIDAWCNRVFYPTLATRYFHGNYRPTLWVPDLVSITSVAYSDDDGETYTSLTTADYYPTRAGDHNHPGSYDLLEISQLSTALSLWPLGQRSVRITGVWAYADDRAAAWESTGDTVEDNPLSSAATTLTLNDVDGADAYGALALRFAPGQLLRIESEYVETNLSYDTTANTIGLVRGRNGTTAAAHVQNTAVDVWRAPEPIRRACVIQVNRQLERGLQGYADSRATPDTGQVTYSRQWDPEAMALMNPYRIRVTA